MKTLFANLTKADFDTRVFGQSERARLHALAACVYDEVQSPLRSESQIAIWLTEMQTILDRKRASDARAIKRRRA